MQRILMTGAAGGVGRMLRPLLRDVCPILRLSDAKPVDAAGPGEETDQTDLADLAAVERMVAGCDGIVHLGAYSVEADWPTILQANIVGTYNLFEAARRQGVQRIVFASTNHVIGFYPRDQVIDQKTPPRPDSRYGVSKAFGEALGALYADKHGLRILNIRIGNVAPKPADKRRLSIWISPRDLAQLVRIGLEHPEIRYETVYGMSDNKRGWWNNANAYRLGYKPQDRSEDYAQAVLAAEPPNPDPIAERYQGGPFCADEYQHDRRT